MLRGLRVVLPLLALPLLGLVTSNLALAQEGVLLPQLDKYRRGLRSMVAADADEMFDALVHGGLDVGSRWSGGQRRGPFATGGLGADVGVFQSAYRYVDIGSEVNARWSLAPIFGDGPAELDVAGHHRIDMMLGGFVDHGGFYLDLAPRQTVFHSTAASWGLRPIDVAPESFVDHTWGMSVWFNHGSRGGPDRPGLKALEVGYDMRATHYSHIPLGRLTQPQTRTVHDVYLGAGYREHNDNALRINLQFLRPHYVHMTSLLTPKRWHRFDVDAAKLVMHGGEVDELSGYLEGTVGMSTAFQDAGGDPVPTANVDLALRFDAPDLLDFGIAGGHHPSFDPAGGRVLGITSFETHLTIDPDPHHYGGTVRGRIDRIVDLVDDVDDAWRGHITGELYSRIFGLQLGADARGSYGDPTGSMGWNPFATEAHWSAYAGGFLRAEACFSARCRKP